MKNILLQLLIFLISTSIFGQYDTINRPLNLAQWGYANQFTQTGDIDGDGQLDFIGSHQFFGETAEIGWVKQLGPDQFSYPMGLKPEVDMLNFTVDDWDGDNDLDIIYMKSGYGFTARIGWLENLGGIPVAWADHDIHSDTFEYQRQIVDSGWGDYDNDGDIDIVASFNGQYSEGLYFFRNLGTGESSPPVLLAEDDLHMEFLPATDMDGDGRKEILYDETYGGLHYIKVEDFGILSPQLIPNISANRYYCKDVNGDDIGDVFTFDFDEGLRLHLSNGSPNVYNTSIDIDPEGTFPINVDDLNGDGIMDVAYRGENGLFTYRLGNDSFDITYSDAIQYDEGYRIGSYLNAVDLNYDGLPELLTNLGVGYSFAPSILSLFSNESDSVTHLNITRDESLTNIAFEQNPNGDYPAIVFAGNCSSGPCIGKLLPYEFRDTSYYASELIGGMPLLPTEFFNDYWFGTVLGDLNSDGEVDAIFSIRDSEHDNLFHTYTLLTNTINEQVATRSIDYDGPCWDWQIFTNDFYGYPIVVKESFYDSLTIFLNEDNDGIPDHVQSYSFPGGRFTSINSIDINEDGYQDILIGYDEYSVTYLMFDPLTGLFSEGQSIEGSTPDTWGFTASDIDQDGIVDIVADGRNGVWCAKGLGNNEFEPALGLYFSNTNATSQIEVLDWDQDGDMDIFILRKEQPIYLEKDSISPLIDYRAHEFESIFGDNSSRYKVLDYDGDGLKDVITHNQKLSIYSGVVPEETTEIRISDQLLWDNNFITYPNPVVREGFYLKTIQAEQSNTRVDLLLIGSDGKVVRTFKEVDPNNAFCPIQGLIAGSYNLLVVSERAIIASKKIIIH